MSEKKEQISLLETLKSMQNQHLQNQEEEKKTYEEMDKEIEEAKNKIKLSYQNKITLLKDNNSNLKKEMENTKKLLEKYSTFNSGMIGNVLAKLVSLVEGEDYSYNEAIHNTYKFECTVFGMDSSKVQNKLLMIVKDNYKKNYYDDYDENSNEIFKLVKAGNSFVLLENEDYFDKKMKSITFYTFKDGILKFLIELNKFSYIKEYIDLVLEYRFKNMIDNISEKELLGLMSKFILSKKEMIENNYKKITLKKQEQLRQQIVDEQLKNNEIIDKMELETLIKNGVLSRYNNNLSDRLKELINTNTTFLDDISHFEIFYESEKYTAQITCSEPFVSSENIFISKIDIKSSIKTYFDDSDPDPHFHGECDIDLVDDGLIGIVDISNLKINLDDIINLNNLYKVDRIDDNYLRVLYLPNKGKYSHKPTNIYSWILSKNINKSDEISKEKESSYKTEWNSFERTKNLLDYLKEVELLSNLNEKQLKIYKQRKN